MAVQVTDLGPGRLYPQRVARMADRYPGRLLAAIIAILALSFVLFATGCAKSVIQPDGSVSTRVYGVGEVERCHCPDPPCDKEEMVCTTTKGKGMSTGFASVIVGVLKVLAMFVPGGSAMPMP